MLIQVEKSKYSDRDDILVYVPNPGKWKTHKLQALSFTAEDREEDIDLSMMAIMGGTFGTITSVPAIILLAAPGYTPATLITGGIAALFGSAALPAARRSLRTPRHRKALETIANDRMHAVVLKRKSGGYSSSSYAMQALLSSSIGGKLQTLFKANAAKNKKQILAQLADSAPHDNMFLKLLPLLDEYFMNTANIDIELVKNRGKVKQADIDDAEAEIRRYASEVAEDLAAIIKIHEDNLTAQADTRIELASENLRMHTRSFRIQRGNFLPED